MKRVAMTGVMMRINGSCIVAQLVLVAVFSTWSVAQPKFVGKWQTKISPATGKHLFTVNINLSDSVVSGTMVLVDPVNGNESTSEICEAKASGRTLNFTTKVRNDTFEWQLTIRNDSREGLLHGSMGEMVIDERVFRRKE